MEARRWVSRYTVTATAGTDPVNDHLFEITVEQAYQMDGTELWAVRRMGRCLNRRGEWSYEPIPSSRTDRWLRAHRFDLETALRLAEKAAPKVTVNGWLPDGSRAGA